RASGGLAGFSVGAGANAVAATAFRTSAGAEEIDPEVAGASLAGAAVRATASPSTMYSGTTTDVPEPAEPFLAAPLPNPPKPRLALPLDGVEVGEDLPEALPVELIFSVLLTRTVDCSAVWRGFMCK